MKSFIFSIFLLLSASVFSQIKLGYDLLEGATFRIIMDTDQSITQEIMGQNMETKQKILMGIEYEVLSNENNLYEISCYYYRMGYEMNTMGMTIKYDSESDENASDNPMGDILGTMLNKPFTIKMTATGAVKHVDGIDALLTEAVNEMELDEAQKAQLREQMISQYGEESIKKSMEQGFRIFPDEKVDVGGTWGFTTKLPGFDVDVSNQYELASYDSEEAKLNITSDVDGSVTQETQGMEVTSTLSGTQSGFIIVERSTGMPLKGELSQDIKGNSSFMGQDIPLTISSTIYWSRERL